MTTNPATGELICACRGPFCQAGQQRTLLCRFATKRWQGAKAISRDLEQHSKELFEKAQAPLIAAAAVYKHVYKINLEDAVRRDLAFEDDRWKCMLPHQYLPLAKITPDVHQVAEMLVRTYKAVLSRLFYRELDIDDDALLKARTFQRRLLLYNSERRKNMADLYAIRRSIEKSINCMYINAYDVGKTIVCKYVFRARARSDSSRTHGAPKSVHKVSATGGAFTPPPWS